MDNVERGDAQMLTVPALDISFGHEGGGDFSLPDYLPVIQRLISVTPTVLPETKFLTGGVLELGGTLAYNILYAGDNGEVSCASYVSEYTADTALPVAVENAGDIFYDCEIESTSCRVTGPRSINIKSRLKSRVMSDEHVGEDGEVLDFDGKCADTTLCSTVEKLSEKIESVIRSHGLTTGNVSGEIKCGGGYKPIMCEGALHPTSCDVTDDSVNVKGEIWGCCLFGNGSGDYVSNQFRLPFESSVHVREALPAAKARAWGRVASMSVAQSEAAPDTFNVSCEYDLEAEACGKSEMVVCCDAYSTSYGCDTESREEDFLKMLCFGTRQLTVGGETEIKNLPEGARLVGVTGQVSGVQVACVEGKPTVCAVLKLRGIIVGETDVASPECEIPVRFEIPDREDARCSDLQSRAVCSLLSADGRCDGSKVTMSAELSIGYEVLEKQKTRYLTAVRLKDETPASAVGSGVRVYYPAKAESLWNICKKYHADRGRVTRHNDIGGDTVPEGMPVIIM